MVFESIITALGILVFFSFGFLLTFKTRRVLNIIFKKGINTNKWFIIRQKVVGIMMMFISLVSMCIFISNLK